MTSRTAIKQATDRAIAVAAVADVLEDMGDITGFLTDYRIARDFRDDVLAELEDRR